ncbi:HTH-type transcriptional activator RhaS [bioreactor metagenome]|uniref:HTH-type transcriptional activator RhaS n=1 Tax=bioreactor metagenome TaxID=1076179 RepID=A0A645EWL2_9ZZZZ
MVFHLHHVRLHYGFFEHGREVKNIYYHTPHPATGILALLADALDRMIHETGTSRPERCRPLLETILRQLKYELTAECDSVQGQHGKLAMRLKNYLEHNFSHPIDCSGISDALGINRSYASTIFHAAFGVTMKEYLTTLRLEAAEELLTSEDGVKVEDIARFCAFSSTGYFIKVFRERYGVSPGEYRKKNINF